MPSGRWRREGRFFNTLLEAAIERTDDDSADALVAALRKQTGIDAGRDPAGWRRWLDR